VVAAGQAVMVSNVSYYRVRGCAQYGVCGGCREVMVFSLTNACHTSACYGH
jgi:hypothetical protein